MALWTLTIAASLILVVGDGSAEGYLVFVLAASILGGAVLVYRLHAFELRAPALLSTGQDLSSFSYRSQTRQGIYLMVELFAFMLVPLFLAGILDTYAWIGSLVGGIDGWLISLLAFNCYLGRWERNHRGKLYSSRVWRGTKVEKTGLRFDRNEVPA